MVTENGLRKLEQKVLGWCLDNDWYCRGNLYSSYASIRELLLKEKYKGE